jgi:cellulose biosynthesis protein BcsQ
MIHITPELQMLRAKIEVGAPHPAAIFVTSALPGDGKTLTAFGLAACLGKAGHRTVLINADSSATAPNERRRPPDLRSLENAEVKRFCRPSKHGAFSTITLASEATEGSRHAIEGLVNKLRNEFEYVIVDTNALPESNLAVYFAQMADAIIVTVCIRRAKTPADLVLIRSLEESPATMLGVVAVARTAIADFAARRHDSIQTRQESLVPTLSAAAPSSDNFKARAVVPG